MFVGVLSFVISISIALAGPEQIRSPAYVVLATLAPLAFWAVAWGASALICLIQAFMHQDRVAFAVGTGMCWAYGIANIVGVFTDVNPRGWVGGMVWIAFGGWLNLIATWPEAPPPLTPREVDHAESA